MDRLWAPWRITYIRGTRKKGKERCIFCAARRDAKDYVLFKTARSVAMLNIFPYNNGHTMVAPLRHTGALQKLSRVEMEDLFLSVQRVMRVLDKVLAPQAYNVGMNLGRTAGAGIPGHLHVHIVPRWNGDTNFMPVTGGTKVISQSLDELYRTFVKEDKKLNG
ncbi:MAG: HIT family protein [Deltaproteobacteria bacterium]